MSGIGADVQQEIQKLVKFNEGNSAQKLAELSAIKEVTPPPPPARWRSK
jgi:hypothetical protein